ncbi:MAG: bifunctional proline dehydrogenase/L-glutamate gamma-semialdehyde dehydrogenase PutA [Candidatus Berkiellales bacterium]
MFNDEFKIDDDPLHQAIDLNYRQDETLCVEKILKEAAISHVMLERIESRAAILVRQVRETRLAQSGIDAFMFQYDLASDEGIALMCLAEALLRIPDKETRDKLIRDKISEGNWRGHLGKSHSLFVNAATWGLMLTGKILESATEVQQQEKSLTSALKRLASKGGEPIVRQAISQAMKILGRQFVMGRTIGGAIKRATRKEEKGYCYSYDMLGEAAYTAQDAQKYFSAYVKAIEAVGQASAGKGPVAGPGISVKLSALHPRFVIAKWARLQQELLPRIRDLILMAKEVNIGLTIDAEEAHTLKINCDLIQAILQDNILDNWEGFGVAIQAYQKRAPYVLDWLIHVLRQQKKRMMVRLVKGAYWDTEIKLAQVNGLKGYPVFTRKIATDVNYIACAKKLLAATDVIYPQFATHNALTLSTIVELAQHDKVLDYEFQCLHGMGDPLYDAVMEHFAEKIPCRIYAPVGTHEELLAYLVRRLLENGANTSFVNRIADEKLPITEMIADPVHKLKALAHKPHTKIPLPQDLFSPERKNSGGVDLSHPPEFLPLLQQIIKLSTEENHAKPTAHHNGDRLESSKRYSPIDRNHYLGTVSLATPEVIARSLILAEEGLVVWQQHSASERASRLEKMADLLQAHRTALLSLLVYEGGKTLDDAVSEVREAIDYCYYYAEQARKLFDSPQILKGPTGEHNQLSLHGRGIIACISPWNFPLAIFLGQVTAALAAGNCVIAKPASQTVLIAAKAIGLLHEAGVPREVVQLLPATGKNISELLLSDQRMSGVVFTGSTDTAQNINHQLSSRLGPIVPLIAETGGQNAMIVDSSALPEQVTQDVITSAFRSAGQRCSALRALFVQEEVADKILTMLQGAMAELKVDHPAAISTDVGPVIDEGAKSQLEAHVDYMKNKGKLLAEVPLNSECEKGSYFAPRLYEIASLDILKQEVFGPILHVIRYKADQLDEVISQINRTGYGLTLGIHSRINETVERICSRVHVGNIYVNRNIIGAVVGVQPFGGERLSGTGPKAGGPHYLPRLAVERTLSINTTASGGNATLMSLNDNE